MSPLDEDWGPLGVVESLLHGWRLRKKKKKKKALCERSRSQGHVFTILPSQRGRFMTISSVSNQKGIFCSSSFLMSIFCEKSGCFPLPGGVCMCAYMSDEVFGNLRAGLIITDISLDAFRPRSSWERSVMPPDPGEKRGEGGGGRKKRWEREVIREMMKRQRTEDEESTKWWKKKGGKVRADICLASLHLACSLTIHSPSSFIK